jgi:uncharacterized protein (DUF2062 family)
MTRLRHLAQIILRVEDTPPRVALAFGLGMFIAFFPVVGTHTALALGAAIVFRLNRVAVLAGSWTSNPWTIVPMLTGGTLVGCALLGVSPSTLGQVDWGGSGSTLLNSLAVGLGPLLWPFVVGNLVLGALAGGASFLVVRAILESRQTGNQAPPR